MIARHLPKNQPGARRVGDRRVIGGIFHVIRAGCPWRQRPPDYGPHTTIYNRFNRWSGKGHWERIFKTLVAGNRIPETISMDASYAKARRSAHRGKGGRRRWPSAARGAARPPISTR